MIYDPMALVIVRSFFNPKEFSAIICFAAEWGRGRAMRPRQFAIIAAGLCGTAILLVVSLPRFLGWVWPISEYTRTINRGPGY